MLFPTRLDMMWQPLNGKVSMLSPISDLMNRMSADPWFGSLHPQIRAAMLSGSKQQHLGLREYAFRRGDGPSGFLAVVSGVLKVSTVLEDGREGVLALLEPGNWFGEASMIDELPRAHDVSVVGAGAEIISIQSEQFSELMLQGVFARSIALLQARRTRSMYAMLEDANLRPTRARVARRLRRLACGDATMGVENRRVITVTHDTLAMMLGVTRQTLTLELKAMVAEGALALGYGHINIRSMELLRAMEQSSR